MVRTAMVVNPAKRGVVAKVPLSKNFLLSVLNSSNVSIPDVSIVSTNPFMKRLSSELTPNPTPSPLAKKNVIICSQFHSKL